MADMKTCPVCGASTSESVCEYCGAVIDAPKQAASTDTSGGAVPTGTEQYGGPEQYGAQEQYGGQEQYGAKEEYGTEDYGSDDSPKIEKTMESTDKKCPSCGGTLVFDPETGGLVCEFCGFTKELPKADEAYEAKELDFNTAKNRASFDWGNKMKTVICQQCGGETVYDALETAACCPFCGSTSVMPVDNQEDVMAPGGVVPFAITKEKAAELFKQWIGHKLFAPTEAKKSCSARDINGVYLPYWTYDSDTTSPFTAEVGFDETKVVNGERKTVTKWRRTNGVYSEFIDDFTVFASKKSDNNPYINSVSQFDFTKLKPYSPELVAGFGAERYSVGLDDGWEVAKKGISKKLQSNMTSYIRKNTRADHVKNLQFNTVYDNITFKYLLAPIWLAAYKYQDTVYNIVINGQTGKVAGKSPISAAKVAIAIAIGVAILIILAILLNNS